MSQQPLPPPIETPARAAEVRPAIATVTLDRAATGDVVRVVSVDSGGEGDPIARRLDDLGLRPGVRVEVLRRAPLGDPTLFELHGYQLCLRRSESARVRVAAEPAAAEEPATGAAPDPDRRGG